MNLHRADRNPQWRDQPKHSYNGFQRVASATNSIVTPANIITIIGLGVVLWGLYLLLMHHYMLGAVLLVVGRALDIVDGVVAEATRTKSPLGEALDASVDKVGTLLTLFALIASGAAPLWVIVVLIVPQVITTIVAGYKSHHGIRVHPTRAGKLSMLFGWVGIVGLIVAAAYPNAVWVSTLAYGGVGISVLLGLYALGQYARQAK